jgi:hypothetical protein
MTTDRDVLWADLVQFDPPSADKVWDGDLRDPDAPGWYADLGSLIHRARGPAEVDELADEPGVVDTMRCASLGAAIVALPRHRGVRSVGRVVAMKAAAAATTASMVGVAAAATTGIVATVAATVVVPAIQEKVRPVIEHVVPGESTHTPSSTPPPARPLAGAQCQPQADICADPSAPVVVDPRPAPRAEPAPVAAEPVTEPAVGTAAAPASTEPTDAATATTVVEAPPEPAPPEPTAEPAPTDSSPVAPASVDPPRRDPPRPDPAPEERDQPFAGSEPSGPDNEPGAGGEHGHSGEHGAGEMPDKAAAARTG